MADLAVLTAVSGADWESQLVSAIDKAPGGLYVARRCVDVPDLLATATAGHGRAVLLSADFRRLDRDVVSRLSAVGVAVVGVVGGLGVGGAAEPGAQGSADRLRSLGIATVVPADIAPDALAQAVQTAVFIAEAGDDEYGAEVTTALLGAGGSTEAGPSQLSAAGEVIVVWGPYGSPGRTTVAVNLASELASLVNETLLIDADTYGASVSVSMGLLDEAPGLAGAARSANNGQLACDALAQYARRVLPRLRVLGGITRPSRWPELRPSSLDVVFEVAREAAAFTVVDAAFCLEAGDDADPMRRNGATLSALRNADRVIAVGTGDAIGTGRLVRGLADVHEIAPEATIEVVINKVRRTFVGRDPEREITGALHRFADVEPTGFIPDDPKACDAALAQGLTLMESSPGAPARQAIAALAARLAAEVR